MKGLRIDSIERLAELAAQRRSVWHHNWGTKPAVVIMNMQACIVWKAVQDGGLHEWEKKGR